MIRAEKLTLVPQGQTPAQARVEAVDYQGQLARYFLRMGDTQLTVMNMIDGKPFAAGETVSLDLNPDNANAKRMLERLRGSGEGRNDP